MGKQQASIGRGKPPRGYTSAKSAKAKLGNISDGKLRELVLSGQIERIVPKGMEQGFYKSADISIVARDINGMGKGVSFEMATREDMPKIVEFLIGMFGGKDTTEHRLGWMKNNEEIAFVLKDETGIVGCVFILPTSLEKIHSVLASDTLGDTSAFTGDDVLPYSTEVPMHLYIIGMVAKPGRTDAAKRIRGELLLRGMMKFFVDLGERGVHIQTIAARSQSADGIQIMKHIGFTELESQTKFRNFMIDVDSSGIPHIMRYKRAYRKQKGI